jgi:hypothetical protein
MGIEVNNHVRYLAKPVDNASHTCGWQVDPVWSRVTYIARMFSPPLRSEMDVLKEHVLAFSSAGTR